MTTDHTETPRTKAFVGDKGPLFRGLEWLDFARQLEKDLTQARAALATAMEERDEAIKERDNCRERWRKSPEAKSEGIARRAIQAEIEACQERDALRARNDALTKALEGLLDCISETRGKNSHDAVDAARRALGKEGL